jgi:hypothetical protein
MATQQRDKLGVQSRFELIMVLSNRAAGSLLTTDEAQRIAAIQFPFLIPQIP